MSKNMEESKRKLYENLSSLYMIDDESIIESFRFLDGRRMSIYFRLDINPPYQNW